MKGQRTSGNVPIIQRIESLGLQTYGKERTDPTAKIRRPLFKHEPLRELYREELTILFNQLLRDDGVTVSRKDPNLFDHELDVLLQEYGPQIWPKPGHGSRDHLLEAKEGTRYTFDIEYPRDSTYIKEHLRQIILTKRPSAGTEHCMTRKYPDQNIVSEEEMSPKGVTIRGGEASDKTVRSETMMELPSRKRKACDTAANPVEGGIDEASESEDSVLGSNTRRQARIRNAHSPMTAVGTKLRLYCKKGQTTQSTPGPTWFRGSLMLTEDITSCEDCFDRICEEVEAACNFIVFQLPEDISIQDPVRIDRESSVSETAFQHVRGILERARRCPDGPPHRSIEVEIGYDADETRAPSEEDRVPSPFLDA